MNEEMTPVTRNEILLAKAAGETVAELTPITRKELFLAKLAGQDVTTPAPITREEMFLQKAIDNGGTGGSGGSEMEEQWIREIERDVSKPVTKLPASVTRIGNFAFYNCTKLTEITFEGTPSSISSSAFSNCTNLLTINVPWAEGEVANAPWGATKATINYNYTGG